jgi:UDP-glucose 4-epimerase
MKYLVTGGAGFIGSHLITRLLEDGENVVAVVDNMSENKDVNLPKNPNLKVFRKSILGNISYLYKGIDIVFHLAALPRPQLSILKPKRHHNTNVNGMLNVLLDCKDNGVQRIVFASSASIYGNQGRLPSKETDTPNPMSPYALHKHIGEQYCRLFDKIYGLNYNCLRFFNVYGTGMNPNAKFSSAVAKFIDMVKQGKSPTIYGTGEQKRDYVYVDDVVEALIIASRSESRNEVFNIGYEKSYSVNHIFESICKKLKKDVKPIYAPALLEPNGTLSDCTKAHKLLNWRAKIDLSEGLDRTLYEL